MILHKIQIIETKGFSGTNELLYTLYETPLLKNKHLWNGVKTFMSAVKCINKIKETYKYQTKNNYCHGDDIKEETKTRKFRKILNVY